MAETEPIKESLHDYLITRIGQAFNIHNKVSHDKFKKAFEQEDNKVIIDNFL